jgi:hypothetical protein
MIVRNDGNQKRMWWLEWYEILTKLITCDNILLVLKQEVLDAYCGGGDEFWFVILSPGEMLILSLGEFNFGLRFSSFHVLGIEML